MAKQTINIGGAANDGSGDSLRDAGQKINSNFTELYNTTGLDTSFTQAAFNKANTSGTTAQSSFDKANTSGTTAQSSFDKANTSGTTAQSSFDKANSANVLAQAAFNQANTVILSDKLASGAFEFILSSNGSVSTPGSIIYNDSVVVKGNNKFIDISNQSYASGGATANVWTASSNNVVAAKVVVRVQQDYDLNTELFTILVSKDASNVNYNIAEYLKSNTSYPASTITAGKDANDKLYVSHLDGQSYGNAYTVDVIEFKKSY